MASGVTLENINGGTVTLQYSGTGNTDKVITIPEVTNTLVTQTDIADKITLVQANAYDIGIGQTWQDVTASRSANVTYTNTSGKPIEVLIQGGGSGTIPIIINGQTIQYYFTSSAGFCSFIVPNANTYSIGGSSITKWLELR